MNFEYKFIEHWWKVFLVAVAIGAAGAWIWVPSTMLALTFAIAAVIGAILGVRKLYQRITRPSCTCCTAGDGCDCERHCELHRPPLPRATIRSR